MTTPASQPTMAEPIVQLLRRTTQQLDQTFRASGYVDLKIASHLAATPACSLDVTLQGHIHYPFQLVVDDLTFWRSVRDKMFAKPLQNNVVHFFHYLDRCLVETWDAILDPRQAVRCGRLSISSKRLDRSTNEVIVHAVPQRRFQVTQKDWHASKPF